MSSATVTARWPSRHPAWRGFDDETKFYRTVWTGSMLVVALRRHPAWRGFHDETKFYRTVLDRLDGLEADGRIIFRRHQPSVVAKRLLPLS